MSEVVQPMIRVRVQLEDEYGADAPAPIKTLASAPARQRQRAKKRTARLTNANVANLKREAKPYLVWDEPRDVGLAVQVQPSGSKAFYVYYQHAPSSR